MMKNETRALAVAALTEKRGYSVAFGPKYMLDAIDEALADLTAPDAACPAVADEGTGVAQGGSWEPVSYLEVDYDDPMHVRHGVVWYKDWDSSEWLTLFPDGYAVCKLVDAPQAKEANDEE